jgi:hypothetical protein
MGESSMRVALLLALLAMGATCFRPEASVV